MTKIFSKPDTLLSIDGFIYLVDKETTILGNYTTDGVKIYRPSEERNRIIKVGEEHLRGFVTAIIATNNPSLEGVAKIGELQEVVQIPKYVQKDIETGAREAIAYSKGFVAGYKAASSKKKYTEDDIKGILEKFHRMNMAYLTGKEDDNLDIDEFIQSLKPSPREICIEMENDVPLLENGCVKIVRCEYETK